MAGFRGPALCEETILRMSVVAVVIGTVVSSAVSASASVSISSEWEAPEHTPSLCLLGICRSRFFFV